MNRIAVAAITAIAIVAILVAVMPFIISGDFLKERVAAQIAAWTGRPVTISGEPTLSLYPHLAITTGGLTIGNPEGMGDDPFVAAEGLRATMRILPLLIGRAEFDEFELIKPRIRLVVGNDGRTNWRMGRSAIVAQAMLTAPGDATDTGLEAAPGAGNGTAQAQDVRIGRLKIDSGIILFDNLASDHREEMSALDLDIVWPSASAAVRGSGSLQWRGERVEFNGSVATPLVLIAGGNSPLRFAIAATAFRLSFTGQASGPSASQIDGQATATTPSLRRVIEWLGTPMGTGPILGAASVEGAVHWAGRTVSFDPAHIELDGNSAEGSLAVDFGGPRPAVQGVLAADKVDLSPYFEAVRADLLSEGSWLIAPTRLAFAEAFDADLKLSTGQVLIGATRVGRLAADVTVSGGTVDVNVGEARFYGGKLKGQLGATEIDGALSARIEASISGVPLRVALTDLADISALDGTATASLRLAGRGKSWGEFARSIAGSAEAAIADGALAGFDIGEVAEAMSDPLAEPLPAGSGTTSFSDLTATLNIGEGNLATENLVMEGNGFMLALTGKGSVLNGLVDARARIDTASETVPIAITGKWRAPVVARDVPEPAPEATPPVEPARPTGG